MCYSKVRYWDGNLDKREHRGRYLSLVRETDSRFKFFDFISTIYRIFTDNVYSLLQVSIRGADGAGTRKFQCICSPTIHPGSFRCRHHHADYKWVARLRHKA